MFKQCCGDCGECWYIGNPRTCTCPDENPKRPWVGLTDEEIEQMGLSNYIKVVRETEAILKEKNT